MMKKKILTILIVALLIISTQMVTLAAVVPETTTARPGQNVTITFEYKGIGGLNGTITFSNLDIIEGMRISVNDDFMLIPTDGETGFLFVEDGDSFACLATSPKDLTITLNLRVLKDAKPGDKCEIKIAYETSVEGEAPEAPSTDTAVIVIEAEKPEIDYSKLEEQIDIADGLNEDDYTEESWAAMKEIYDDALALLGNAETQEEVDAMTEALKEAIAALVLKLDYSKLEEQIDIADGLNENDYTKDSWEAMKKVYEEAKALLGNAETQEEIDALTAKLEAAIKALVLVGANTGDNTNLFGLVALAILSVATASAVVIKKRKVTVE